MVGFSERAAVSAETGMTKVQEVIVVCSEGKWFLSEVWCVSRLYTVGVSLTSLWGASSDVIALTPTTRTNLEGPVSMSTKRP